MEALYFLDRFGVHVLTSEGVKTIMGKSLQDLGLVEEQLPTQTLDELPEFGQFQDPPQPGPYRFKLPTDLSAVWDLVDASKTGGKGQRVRMIFDRDHPLTIVKAADEKLVGERFDTRISNVERTRGKDKTIEVSDLDYLLKALGEKVRPQTNKQYIETIKKYAGKEFGADVSFSWRCSKDRNIRVADPQDPDGKLTEVENTPGCGKGYYQRDVQKVEGQFPLQIQCACGAVLRAFANLDSIRA